MSTRTTIKQQLMRQRALDDEKPHKGVSNVASRSCYSAYKDFYSDFSLNNESLPTITATMIAAENQYSYCEPYIDQPDRYSYQPDAVNAALGEDLSILNMDYNEPRNNRDSPYIMHNIYPIESTYSVQSYNTDYSQQSSNLDNNIDSNSYNSQYHNLGGKTNHIGHVHDMYRHETSISCPVTGEQSTSNLNPRRMSNSISPVVGNIPLNNDEKRTLLKDRSKKDSHNRIERRRRDFINQQIVELSNLLPSEMMAEGDSKKNKGNILRNSVLYIQHLQNKANYTSNYVKESDLAFMLVDSYRKQIQDLQQQFQESHSEDLSLSPARQTISEKYSQYMMLHEQNRRTYQASNQILIQTNNPSSEGNLQFPASSYTKSPSTVENGSLKIEPSSAHSSTGNNSLSTTYRIDEETDGGFNNFDELMSQRPINQSYNPNYPSLPTKRVDPYFNTSNHYRGTASHSFESMEC